MRIAEKLGLFFDSLRAGYEGWWEEELVFGIEAFFLILLDFVSCFLPA